MSQNINDPHSFNLISPEKFYSRYSPTLSFLPQKQQHSLRGIKDQVLSKMLPNSAQQEKNLCFPELSEGATGVGDSIADVSWLFRTVLPEASTTEWLGFTTGENTIRGLWSAIKAWRRFQQAQRIEDQGGMIESGIDFPRGLAQSAGGAFYLAYRGLMMAADKLHINPSAGRGNPLGKAAFATHSIGNVCFNLFYVAITAWATYGYYKNAKFSSDLEKASTTSEDLAGFFEKKAIANSLSKLNKSAQNLPELRRKYFKLALEVLTERLYLGMQSLAESEQETPPGKEEIEEFVKNYFNLGFEEFKKSPLFSPLLASLGLKESDIASYKFSFLELLGFKFDEMLRQQRKEAKLTRVAGSAAPKIKKALSRGLQPRLHSENEEIRSSAIQELSTLKKESIKENSVNKVVLALLFGAGILGIVSSIIGFFPALGAVAGVFLIGLTLFLCAGMLATDAYFMFQGWGTGAPGRFDFHYLCCLVFIVICIVSVSIGMTLSWGLPLLPMIATCVFGAVSLKLCFIAFVELNYKKQKWKFEHPDLEAFEAALVNSLEAGEGDLDAKVTFLFKKLPKEQKAIIRKKYFESSGNLSFKSQHYRNLDSRCDFSTAFLNAQMTEEGFNNSKEYTLFLRGIQKTLRFYWEKWEIEKTEESKHSALEAQALYEAVNRKNLSASKIALHALHCRPSLARLKSDLWYIAKRQESKEDLLRIVRSMYAARDSKIGSADVGQPL